MTQATKRRRWESADEGNDGMEGFWGFRARLVSGGAGPERRRSGLDLALTGTGRGRRRARAIVKGNFNHTIQKRMVHDINVYQWTVERRFARGRMLLPVPHDPPWVVYEPICGPQPRRPTLMAKERGTVPARSHMHAWEPAGPFGNDFTPLCFGERRHPVLVVAPPGVVCRVRYRTPSSSAMRKGVTDRSSSILVGSSQWHG